jgi:transcriptional regulator with XRE-family HTH domain
MMSETRQMEIAVMGALLSRLRKAADIEQARACHLGGLSQPTLSRIERGASAKVSIYDLTRLFDAYGYDLQQGIMLYEKSKVTFWDIVTGVAGKDLEDDAERWQGSIPEIAALAVTSVLREAKNPHASYAHNWRIVQDMEHTGIPLQLGSHAGLSG